MATGATLDELDRGILRLLQDDGRRPFREIARQVGVSERTVRVRFRRMEEAGVVRILAFADPFALDHQVLAIVLLRVQPDAQERVVSTLTDWPEISYVSTVIGRPDVLLQVVCRDNEALWDLVTHRVRGLGGVIETETMIETHVHKFTYRYPSLALEGGAGSKTRAGLPPAR